MKHIKKLKLNELNRYDKWLEDNKDVNINFDIDPPIDINNTSTDLDGLYGNNFIFSCIWKHYINS